MPSLVALAVAVGVAAIAILVMYFLTSHWRESQQSCAEHLFQNRTEEAFTCFTTHHFVSRSAQVVLPGEERPSLISVLKLQHDTEMYEYFEQHGLLSQPFMGAARLYKSVLASALRRHAANPTALLAFNNTDPLWQRMYDRAVVWGPAGSSEQLEGGLLSSSVLDGADQLTKSYHGNGRGINAECKDQDGWVVIDNFLKPAALERLRRFLVESSFYYTIKRGGHYLVAHLEDGLASPLLLQLVEELKAAFPDILGKHFLRMAWAFKYDNSELAPIAPNVSEHGVPIHADAAAVNVNIWLLDLDDEESEGWAVQHHGGLTLWQAEAPAGEQFSEYNTVASNPKIQELCNRSSRSEIAYRPNRLVMFNSNLFHATQPIRVRPGFQKRRINLTLLFGDRCGHFMG